MQRLGRILLGVLIVPALVALVLLLPILLPAAMAAEALSMRRLARTRCVVCGSAIGIDEIRRAAREARIKARGVVEQVLLLGGIPRVIVPWEVTCPTCGQAYEHHCNAPRVPGLVAKRNAG